MPFVGRKNAEIVTPEEVDDDETVTCIGCQDDLKPRSSHHRDGEFVARHFWHPTQTDCEGDSLAESAKHQKMKSISISKAKQRWPNASVEPEMDLGNRRGDVVVDFDSTDERLGEGVVIEVQHKHKGKDIIRVTEEYAEAGYSSLWLNEEHFDGKNVDFDAGDWNIHWALEVPDDNEWSGRESFVDQLAAKSDPSVEVEIKIPESWREVIPERQLRRAWFDGFQESWSENQEYEYRKEKYENIDSEWVDIFKRKISGGRKTKWVKLVKSPSGTFCLQLGKTTGSGSDTTTVTLGSDADRKLNDIASVLSQITRQHPEEAN